MDEGHCIPLCEPRNKKKKEASALVHAPKQLIISTLAVTHVACSALAPATHPETSGTAPDLPDLWPGISAAYQHHVCRDLTRRSHRAYASAPLVSSRIPT